MSTGRRTRDFPAQKWFVQKRLANRFEPRVLFYIKLVGEIERPVLFSLLWPQIHKPLKANNSWQKEIKKIAPQHISFYPVILVFSIIIDSSNIVNNNNNNIRFWRPFGKRMRVKHLVVNYADPLRRLWECCCCCVLRRRWGCSVQSLWWEGVFFCFCMSVLSNIK